MLYAVHYEPDEFVEVVKEKNLQIFVRIYVLECGIAGMVYMAKDEENLYYLDKLIVSDLKVKEFEQLDAYEVHQELYARVNLDESCRRRYRKMN